MESWRTAIVDAGPTHIRVRGHDVLDLMQRSTFTDLIFLLHHERLPSDAERRLIDAILIGSADHGARARRRGSPLPATVNRYPRRSRPACSPSAPSMAAPARAAWT
jgi:citrate synthase